MRFTEKEVVFMCRRTEGILKGMVLVLSDKKDT